MAIYLQIPGTEGNVTAKGFENWIELISVQLSVSRDIKMVTGNVSNRENRTAQLSTVDATLKFSKHSTALFTEATVGDTGKEYKIVFCQTSKNEAVPYLTYKLNSALISQYSIGGDGVEEPIEHVSISYSAIEMTYADHAADNKLGGQQVAAYNVQQATPAYG